MVILWWYLRNLPKLLLCYRIAIAFFLFLIRAFAAGVFQAVIAYTPEVYPTGVRAAAMGLHSAMARVGAMITPFVAQVSDHGNSN